MEEIPSYSDLDNLITEQEIQYGINKLKNRKTPGLDGISNEMLKCGRNFFSKILIKIFNNILSNGIYPTAWAEGYIVPIHKKNDKKDPNNYRGITISNSLGKLFNSILQNRLSLFVQQKNIINEEQIGFQKGCRTSDHMFILNSIIDLYRKNKRKLFICFVDFSQAFDKIWHTGLFHKLKEIGISSRFYKIVKDMYSKVSLRVRVGNYLTPIFRSTLGVRQGDVLSPLLFNLYINDIPKLLKQCAPAKLNDIPVNCLMYADDLVFLSETTEGLQKAINILSEFCNKWKMKVNTSKTKILCINTPDKSNVQIKYNGDLIEIVSNYTYLGISFSDKGNFKNAIEILYQKGLKVYFKLIKVLYPFPKASTALHLFNHLIKPIILYGCEIWGPTLFKNIIPEAVDSETTFWKKMQKTFPLESKCNSHENFFEKLHIKYCKTILGVHNKTSNIGVYGELGCFPLYIDILKSCRRYNTYLENNTNNALLRKIYKSLSGNLKFRPKITDICQQLHSLNATQSSTTYKHQPVASDKTITKLLKSRFIQYWHNLVSTPDSKSGTGGNKLRTYNLFKQCHGMEPYLNLGLHREQVTGITRLCLSAHKLKIETDRYNYKNKYISPNLRICSNCNLNTPEDEEHFIIQCTKYIPEREHLFQIAKSCCTNFLSLSDRNKFMWIMSCEHREIICALGVFINLAFKARDT